MSDDFAVNLAFVLGAAVVLAFAGFALRRQRRMLSRRDDRAESHALEQRALSPEPTAPDIFASRLIALIIASRVVFPWVRDPKTGASYPPVSAIWQGTAAKLRETLTARGSRLSFYQRRELPAPEVLDHRLAVMSRSNGRVRIERIGYADGQVWRITLNH